MQLAPVNEARMRSLTMTATTIPFPPEADHEVAIPQGTIRYRDVGAGPVLVFVGGYLVDGRLWRDVVPRLAPDFRCVVPDVPFGAHSTPMPPGADLSAGGLAEIVAAFMAALELEDVTLVANDSGGAVSQLVVARHPDRIARLVLTPCDAFDAFPPAMFKPLKVLVRIPGMTSLLAVGLRAKAVRLSPIGYGMAWKRAEAGLTRAWAEPAITDAAIRRDLRKVTIGLDKRYTREAAARHGDFDRPVLIAWAPEDKFFAWELGERLAAAYPDARLERVEDSYAFAPLDQPARIAALVAAFAREPARAPAAV
jgi:pimeloyl-ACP methyl ester carboxylesterase